MKDIFKNIIGQQAAKRKATELVECYNISRYFPPALYTAPKGDGKTTLAIETAKNLVKFNEIGKPEINAETGKLRIKPLAKINCANLTNVKAFINDTVIRFIADKDVTVLFDEASEIPHSISMAMLDIFNTVNESNNYRTTFQQEEYVCDFDFRRQSFIFCTSEPQKMFHALSDRLERIELSAYNIPELAAIIKKNLPGIEVEEGLLEEVAEVVRGNGRGAYKMATKINNFLRGDKTFMVEDWNRFKKVWDILPLGLNQQEIGALRFLSENNKGTSLTRLASKTGLSREAVQRDVELFLLRNDLMNIETGGRMISAKGLQYLKMLDK